MRGVVIATLGVFICVGCSIPTGGSGDGNEGPAPGSGYHVTYHRNEHSDGSPPRDDSEYQKGDVVEVLGNISDLRKAGHGFTGWNTEATGSGDTREVGSTFAMPGEDVTLYAQWKDVYAIGDEGPAGGWIVYDYGSVHSDGWRYLEAAPEDVSDGPTETFAWSNIDTETVGGTLTEIGTGGANTKAIVFQSGHDSSAAQYALDDTTESLGSVFDDWFLPSLDELGQMYANLHDASPSLDGFAETAYWTSSEVGSDTAGYQRFDTGQEFNGFKDTVRRVRSARAF